MITFIAALLALLVGHLVYGRYVSKLFRDDNRVTPAMSHNDGVDYVPMKTWRIFLIQLLNIAGTGPIFGALMGAVYGPIVYIWIVLGSIFAGAVHDYVQGMISLRSDGSSVVEQTGTYLGKTMRTVMLAFTLLLLVLVGTVFVTSPAALLAMLTPSYMGTTFWLVVILLYYVAATLLPIDKIIGKLYPVFGVALITMALGIAGGIMFKGYHMPELTLANLHPKGLAIFPFMCVTVACGAISGFHATQSPLMARCMKTEKEGHIVFYGAMISEGVIALIWASAGVAFYNGTGGLLAALTKAGQSGVVYEISTGLLGPIGGILAIVGVIACPITSGDTAFRSARLIIADRFGIDQKSMAKRVLLTIPLLLVGAVLTQIDFNVLWRYFSWSNQTLATIVLWTCTAYIIKESDNKALSLITAIPATFMSSVVSIYIMLADEGFRLSASISYPVGFLFAGVLFAFYVYNAFIKKSSKLLLEK